jgi:hypothetical protein
MLPKFPWLLARIIAFVWCKRITGVMRMAGLYSSVTYDPAALLVQTICHAAMQAHVNCNLLAD